MNVNNINDLSNKDFERFAYNQVFGLKEMISKYTKDCITIEADDVIQEVLNKVSKKLNTLDDREKLRSWIVKIMFNEFKMMIRSGVYSQIKFRYQPLNDAIDISINGLGEINLEVQDILKYVEKLPPSQKKAFNLYHLQGYDHLEIAEKLQIRCSTSRSNLRKGVQKLKIMLRE